MMFLKSGFTSRGFFPTLKAYVRAVNKIRILYTDYCEIHEHRVYDSRDSGADRKTGNCSVVVRGEGDNKENI